MERDPTTMLVAQNIKALMKAKNLDPAKLGRLAGLNATGIYDILSGKSRSPKINTIGKIAQGLGVPVSAIFEDASDADLKDDLLSIYHRLAPEQPELLLTTGRAWVEEVA